MGRAKKGDWASGSAPRRKSLVLAAAVCLSAVLGGCRDGAGSASAPELLEMCIRDRDREGMPVLRYRTKDITRLNYEPCACGRTHVRMEKPMGRKMCIRDRGRGWTIPSFR